MRRPQVAEPDVIDSPTGLDATTPWVRRWLRAEGIAALVGGFAAWLALGAPWPVFFALLLVPDISMVGYLADRHVGAISYNIGHNWAVGGLVLGLGIVLTVPAVTLAGVILVAHTGMDRAFGYGLKYPTSFQDTHLGRIGRRR
ncbi:MAG: DUF4260 domain-containing protein [Candidatus Limnocylindrales bacterium]